MSKTYHWEIPEVAEEGGEELLHTVCLTCSPITGKAVVTIDGTTFNISEKPFRLRGTSQMFRLGELPALLEVPKKGAPNILVDGKPAERKEK